MFHASGLRIAASRREQAPWPPLAGDWSGGGAKGGPMHARRGNGCLTSERVAVGAVVQPQCGSIIQD
jgi:hypothetical protein